MDPDIRILLKKNLELSEENNKMLKSMRNSQRINTVLRLVYWVFIIGLAIWSIKAIEPYLTGVLDTYGTLFGSQNGTSTEQGNSEQFGQMMELFKKYQSNQ